MCLLTHRDNSLLTPNMLISHTKQVSATPTGCPIISFSSDTLYLELVQTPQLKGSVPQDNPLPPPQAPLTVQAVTCASAGRAGRQYPLDLCRPSDFLWGLWDFSSQGRVEGCNCRREREPEGWGPGGWVLWDSGPMEYFPVRSWSSLSCAGPRPGTLPGGLGWS